jgi:hypothetical protein
LEDRALFRTRVLLTGTLMTAEGAVQVRVRDLSSAGAQIWTEHPIEAGGDAVFKRGELFVAAKIVWSYEHRAGLSFYREIDVEQLLGVPTADNGNHLASTPAVA